MVSLSMTVGQLWLGCCPQVIPKMVTPVYRTPYGDDGTKICQWHKALKISWRRQYKQTWSAEHIQDDGLSQKKLNHITRTYWLTIILGGWKNKIIKCDYIQTTLALNIKYYLIQRLTSMSFYCLKNCPY